MRICVGTLLCLANDQSGKSTLVDNYPALPELLDTFLAPPSVEFGVALPKAVKNIIGWPAPGFEDTKFGVFMEPGGGSWRDGSLHESSSLRRVKLIRDRGVGVTQASRDLGVHQTVLRSWLKAYGDDPVQAFPGLGQQKPEAAEIARLKREVTKLKAERDILKKAAAYFAKEST